MRSISRKSLSRRTGSDNALSHRRAVIINKWKNKFFLCSCLSPKAKINFHSYRLIIILRWHTNHPLVCVNVSVSLFCMHCVCDSFFVHISIILQYAKKKKMLRWKPCIKRTVWHAQYINNVTMRVSNQALHHQTQRNQTKENCKLTNTRTACKKQKQEKKSIPKRNAWQIRFLF